MNRLKTTDEKYCAQLNDSDIKNVTIGLDTLKDKLKEDKDIYHLQDYLIIGCPRGHGSFRPSEKRWERE